MSVFENSATHPELSRRHFLTMFTCSNILLITAPGILGACVQKEPSATEESSINDANRNPCSDLSDIAESEIALRSKLGYVDISPIADNKCSNCNLHLPPSADKKCSTCMLFKGPVQADGYCTYWAPKIG